MTYLQKKKLSFMTIVNRIKGFVRSISGALPLTLTDCVDEYSLIDYTISGNSMQNGTPSPDNPVEVESVGEKTINMFNPDWLEQGTITDTAGKLLDSTTRVRTSLVSLEAGTYYLHVNAGIIRGIHIYNYLTEAWVEYINCNCNATASFTLEQTFKVRFVFNFSSNAVITPDYVKSKNPMLALSETAVDYEPCGKYKIPVVCRGKNIVGDYIYTNQTTQYWGVITAKKDFTLKQGVTYTISFDTPNTNMLVYYAQYTNVTEGFKATRLDGKRKFITITPTKDITTNGIISVSSAMSDGIGTGICSNCMIEEGTTATDYEPYAEPVTTNIYLDEPLRKIGDYADYIDFENQKVIRNIYEKVLTGTEGWTSPVSSAYCISAGYVNPRHDYSVRTNVLCTHLQPSNSNYIQGVGVSSSNLIVNYDNGAMGISAWKQLLKDLYAANTPIIIYYVRAEQEETPITIPKLPTIKGTTIYTIGTTAQPTNMSATYYSTVKE